MTKKSKINQGIINKLDLVQKFIDEIYFGKQQYKPPIVFISNTLNGIITDLKKGLIKIVKGQHS